MAPFKCGYAPTSAPADGRYHSALMARDAVELIGALGSDRAYLIGNDWGAGAVVGATALAPEKVIKLVTIASGRVDRDLSMEFEYRRGTWNRFFFQRPEADYIVAHNDYVFVEGWWRWASPEWDIPAEALESIRSTFRKPGVVQAALGYYRARYDASQVDDQVRADQAVISAGPVTVPMLALHGTRDRPCRLESFLSSGMYQYFKAGLEKVIIPGTGHFMHQERPEEVNPKILKSLQR